MKALIDCDMLVYQVGFGVQYKDPDTGEPKIRNFDACIELLEQIIDEIKEESWASEEPTFYLTGDEKLLKYVNKRRKRAGLKPRVLKPNFRESLAVSKEYKGGRKADKPFHFDSIRNYILSEYDVKIAWGMEADDLICIDHRLNPDDTLIATRDKDLRICPGLHYGWSCYNQPSFGPVEIDELGYLELGAKGKLSGGGLKFFYSQLLTGDSTDNIPGLPGKGPAFAYKVLDGCSDEGELHEVVAEAYKEKIGDTWEDYFLEQAQLLWMVQELTPQGEPVMFVPFNKR